MPLSGGSAVANARERAAVRWRQREWSWIAATAAALCLVFSVWPELDVPLSRFFIGSDGVFVGKGNVAVMSVYHAVPWVSRAIGVVALVLALYRRPVPALGARWRRRTIVLGVALAVGVGIVVNGFFKSHWGRARPEAVVPLGGSIAFTPPLEIADHCTRNCSFVSGHAASGFALMAVGLFGVPATRRRWLLIGAGAGLVIGLGRMAQGAHFASDVLFAGVIVWACNAAIRRAWLAVVARRRAPRRR